MTLKTSEKKLEYTEWCVLHTWSEPYN